MKSKALRTIAILALMSSAGALRAADPDAVARGEAASIATRAVADAEALGRAGADIELAIVRAMPAPKRMVDPLLASPLPLLRLWKAYGFSPAYAAKPATGGGLHVDDPTGVAADLHAVPAPADAIGPIVYLAYGVVTHRLAPAFRGKAILALSTADLDGSCILRVEVRLRMDNRLVGFLARAIYPLVKNLVTRRIDSNLVDLATILADLSENPAASASRLSPADAAELLGILFGRS